MMFKQILVYHFKCQFLYSVYSHIIYYYTDKEHTQDCDYNIKTCIWCVIFFNIMQGIIPHIPKMLKIDFYYLMALSPFLPSNPN